MLNKYHYKTMRSPILLKIYKIKYITKWLILGFQYENKIKILLTVGNLIFRLIIGFDELSYVFDYFTCVSITIILLYIIFIFDPNILIVDWYDVIVTRRVDVNVKFNEFGVTNITYTEVLENIQYARMLWRRLGLLLRCVC